jgi:hypothetical protein
MFPFLEKPCLVQHQNARRIAKPVHDIIAADVAGALGIPKSAPEHRLHPPRRFIAHMFGQLPTVLALHPANQAVEIKPGLRASPSAESSAKPLIQSRQFRRPRQRRSRSFDNRCASPPQSNSWEHINPTLPANVVLTGQRAAFGVAALEQIV